MDARSIAAALGGSRSGSGWIARCPAHDDRTPSLSLRDGRDGRVLVKCHAGCEQLAVLQALHERGLWTARTKASAALPKAQRLAPPIEAHPGALAIWDQCLSASGSLVQAYLTHRMIKLPPPPQLRFHSGLRHSVSGEFHPAMVALVTLDAVAVAIHRTFLASDGRGKASVAPQKMMLGPCAGGAVRLGPDAEHILIGEGIETCLAAMQATELTAWAALSASGLVAVRLPVSITAVTILADGDPAGARAAQACGQRLKREGRHVRIAAAPRGMDFNDMLMAA
jgi:putative DNA primase/helicase